MNPTMRTPTLFLVVAGALTSGAAWADNKVSFQALNYLERNERMRVADADVSIERDFGTDYTLHVDYGFDAVSGATPAWVRRPGYVNEFVEGTAKVQNEKRRAVGATLAVRDKLRNEYTFGGSQSVESDFVSNEVSAQAQIWHDDMHNRSYTVGLGIQSNTALGSPDGYTNNKEDRASDAYNLQAGVNQVLDRTSTLEGSFYLTRDTGYLSNHYLKVVRQDSLGNHYLADDDRPEKREGGGIATRWVKSWRDDLSTNLWYRYYSDDWGIRSHTVEGKLYWEPADHWKLNPVVRLYQQSAANFYRGYGDAVNTFASTGFASNDARLGEFTARTAQVNVMYSPSKEWAFNWGISHYRQDNGFSARSLTAGLSYRY